MSEFNCPIPSISPKMYIGESYHAVVSRHVLMNALLGGSSDFGQGAIILPQLIYNYFLELFFYKNFKAVVQKDFI